MGTKSMATTSSLCPSRLNWKTPPTAVLTRRSRYFLPFSKTAENFLPVSLHLGSGGLSDEQLNVLVPLIRPPARRGTAPRLAVFHTLNVSTCDQSWSRSVPKSS